MQKENSGLNKISIPVNNLLDDKLQIKLFLLITKHLCGDAFVLIILKIICPVNML